MRFLNAKITFFSLLLLSIFLLPCEQAFAAEHLDGSKLSIVWTVPFVGILLSIAVLPLIAPNFWHKNFGKVSLGWILALLIPLVYNFGFSLALNEVVHTLVSEYIPFIILLFALYTVAGGILLRGSLVGTPVVNTGILFVGTVLASWMGTTGAAMLLIRPLLRANSHRKYNVHTIVFFIFLVANIGGSLTPLGDPPLFLGFLKDVPFFWTMTHLFLPTLFVSAILLVMHYVIDSILFIREGKPKSEGKRTVKLALEGKVNFLLLFLVVGSVLLSGLWRPGVAFAVYGSTSVELQNLVRDILLLTITGASLYLTKTETRSANDFNWFPMIEVVKLFSGIFISMIPAIAILKAGQDGALARVIDMVSSHDGEPINHMYFGVTGLLSSFLDNTPAYLVLFNTAGGDAAILTTTLAPTLVAISAGAVFMGATTYIGNAPNFMVRSIAQNQGIAMPSFFGYMLWSGLILLPIFGLVTIIFIK